MNYFHIYCEVPAKFGLSTFSRIVKKFGGKCTGYKNKIGSSDFIASAFIPKGKEKEVLTALGKEGLKDIFVSEGSFLMV
ncbi:MAG: hypothetical protein CMI53_00485 [Parcubacteria group bacterium]|nr:hypothetical protein [Parcubacteria group bacterium]